MLKVVKSDSKKEQELKEKKSLDAAISQIIKIWKRLSNET